jgi:hypothetical protein
VRNQLEKLHGEEVRGRCFAGIRVLDAISMAFSLEIGTLS